MAKKISDTAKKALRAKANKSKKYTLTDLQKVYRRGQGAYLGSGSRPGVSMAAWAMARVNKLIKLGRRATFDKEIIRSATKRKKK